MPLLNKLFGKSKPTVGRVETPQKAEPVKKVAEFSAKGAVPAGRQGSASGGKSDSILLSPLATEKAVSGQSLNKYIFKITSSANKIEVAKAVGKNYNVKVVSVNIVNIPRKARRVGKTKGFKSGYKKAIVTLATGQSIEIK